MNGNRLLTLPHDAESPDNRPLLPAFDADYRALNPTAGGIGSRHMCLGVAARTARRFARQEALEPRAGEPKRGDAADEEAV